MNEKESRAKNMVREISDKIDELLEQSDISKEDVKKEINVRIEELKRSRDEVNEELKKIREDNKETIDKVEKMAKNTVKEVKKAFSDFFNKTGTETKEEKPENEEKKGE